MSKSLNGYWTQDFQWALCCTSWIFPISTSATTAGISAASVKNLPGLLLGRAHRVAMCNTVGRAAKSQTGDKVTARNAKDCRPEPLILMFSPQKAPCWVWGSDTWNLLAMTMTREEQSAVVLFESLGLTAVANKVAAEVVIRSRLLESRSIADLQRCLDQPPSPDALVAGSVVKTISRAC
jgi:hypothetical protein